MLYWGKNSLNIVLAGLKSKTTRTDLIRLFYVRKLVAILNIVNRYFLFIISNYLPLMIIFNLGYLGCPVAITALRGFYCV